MRKLILAAPLLLIAFLAARPARAADFPIFSDGGSLVKPLDAGTYIAVDMGTSGFNASVRCPVGVNYQLCDGTCTKYDCTTCPSPNDGGMCTSTVCVPTASNLYLAPEVTYDLGVPGSYRQFAIKVFDAGIPQCNVFKNRSQGE